MKLAIFAAFPQELSHICRHRVPAAVSRGHSFRISTGRYREADLICVETGMNPANLDAAFRHVITEYLPDIVLSVGFGGALYLRAGIGELVVASRYFFFTREGPIELPLLNVRNERFQQRIWQGPIAARLQQKLPVKTGSFVTLSQWTEKAKLKACMPRDAAYPVCERETVHLAKRCYDRHIPFFAIRAITDRLDENIPPDFFTVTDENGTYSLSRALGLLISRPLLIPECVKLGRHAAVASRNLGRAVRALVEVIGSSRMAMKSFLDAHSCSPESESVREDGGV